MSVDCWPLQVPSRFLPPHVPNRPRGVDSTLRDFTSDADVFSKQSIVVTSLYSRHLGSGPSIMATVDGARIFVHDTMPDGIARAWGEEPRNDLGEFESHHTEVDRRIIGLADPQRRQAMLTWLHSTLLELAALRDWPTEAFDRAHQLCQEDGLRFRVDGRAKLNPGRTRRALPSFEIDGNGDGWLTLVIEDGAGNLVQTLGPWDTPTSAAAWTYVLRSLRWRSSTAVSVNHWPESANWPGAPDPLEGIEIAVE